MRREDIPEPTESGLSTEDLAQSRQPGAGEGAGGAGAAREPVGTRERTGVPAFPGESTAGIGRTPPADETAGAPATETAGTETAATGASATQAAAPTEEEAPRLLAAEDEEGFRQRWQDIQTEFVDDPREAVHRADTLVADVMQQLASNFADHKKELEGQWNRGEEADTERLRMALRKYRSFFNRLLTT